MKPRPTSPVVALAAYKIFVLAFVGTLVAFCAGAFNVGNYEANFHWPSAAPPSWTSGLKTWDAQHYLYLSSQGYGPDPTSNNFFPLWPFLIRFGSVLFLGHHLAAALVLSNLLSLVALWLFHSYVEKSHGGKIADSALWLLMAYPGALFLNFPYAESLFFFLSMLLFTALARRKHGAAAAAAFLLPLARPQGILVALAFWYGLWRDPVHRRKPATWALAAAPLAGLAALLLFMKHATGDALATFRSYETLYAYPPLYKLLDISAFVEAFLRVTAFHDYTGSLLDRLWFAVFAAALVPLWRRDKLHFAYALPMGLIPALSFFVGSYNMRHLLLIFPVFMLGGERLAGESRRWQRRAVLAALFALQAVFLASHVNNDWVG